MTIIRDNTFFWKNRFVAIYIYLSREENGSMSVIAAMRNIQLFKINTDDENLAKGIYNLLDDKMSFEKASIMMRLFSRLKGNTNAREVLLELFSYKQEVYKYRIAELESEYGFVLEEEKNFLGKNIAVGFSTIKVSLSEQDEPIGEFRGRNNGKASFKFHFYNV